MVKKRLPRRRNPAALPAQMRAAPIMKDRRLKRDDEDKSPDFLEEWIDLDSEFDVDKIENTVDNKLATDGEIVIDSESNEKKGTVV